jgi:glycosyltransferase involved in cell wall biosynthesis
VGFLARLSIEKNPGLFLQSAKHLLEKCPVCRFRIIGDGPIRSELEELTRRLEMAWAVKFLGLSHPPFSLIIAQGGSPLIISPLCCLRSMFW